MNLQEHTTPARLERYSFIWSEVRLVIAAVALIWGAVPPLTRVSLPVGLTYFLLTIAWILSGAAAAYLLYEWYKRKTVFGASAKMDLYAFWIMVVSGLNLGLTGIFKNNIGMSLIPYGLRFIFLLVGILYIAAAYHLYKRWKANGEKVF